ncbi:unnamed protein product [Fusarium langsethiae]|nr:unnamed protein product [Fusarium langsethiae]
MNVSLHNAKALNLRYRIPFVQARVLCEGGDGRFIDPDESTNGNCLDDIQRVYGRQPAFDQPRTNWEHWDDSNPIEIDLADSSDTLQQKLRGVKHPYYDEPGAYIKFPLHADDTKDLMKDLVNKKMVGGQSLLALARMASYGLENVVSVAHSQIQIISQTSRLNRDFKISQPALPPTYQKVECNFLCGFYSIRDLRTQMYAKRFFIGIIHHGSACQHWTSFIWDRVRGDLYHFDSFLPDQVLRTTNVAYMWRELLASCGMPYNFNIFQGPITPQEDSISCGPLCIFMIFRFLGGLVGCTGEEVRRIHRSHTLQLVGQPPTGASTAPVLLFSDWVVGLSLDRPSTHKAKAVIALNFIKAFFYHLCLEDLGVRQSNTVFYTKWRRDGTTVITPCVKKYSQNNDTHTLQSGFRKAHLSSAHDSAW